MLSYSDGRCFRVWVGGINFLYGNINLSNGGCEKVNKDATQ